VHLDRGELDAAIADLKKAIRINPNTAESFQNLGIALRQKGRWTEAIEDFGRAIAINPRFAVAYVGRGLTHLLRGRKAEADRDFEESLKLDAHLVTLIERRKKELRPLINKGIQDTQER